jgi:tape measure domain-containing protein
MAQDNVLGIQATINGKDIKQGADEFIGQVSRMEQAADKFVNELAGKSKMINGQVQSIGVSFNDVVGVISKGAAALGIAFSAQQFVTQVARTRGEFQQLEVAFTTMLGSADKASALMAQITRTAAVTPFGLQEVAGGAKSLMAYGVEAEKVNDTLVRLGDIASGLSIPLNDLVYLYGTTMTQGKMFTQDLRQFQGRGIPLADELAKQFGVTKDRVGELVTAGKVGFADLEKAIISMTSEGGKFGGLMEAQSKTIIGQWRNIEDSIESMFNEIGKSQEGVINSALEGVSLLVENYETVGRSILALVATYGTYKAALITTIVLHKSWAVAARVDAAAKIVLTAATKAQTVAQLALNAAMKANPAVLLATAVVGLGTAMWALSDHTSAAEKGLAEYNARQEELRKSQENEKNALEEIVDALNGEENAYMSVREAKAKMLSEFPQLAAQFMDEKGQIKDLAGLWEEYGKQAADANLKAKKSQLTGLEGDLSAAEWGYNTATKLNNRSDMKQYKERIDFLKPQIEQAKKEVEELEAAQKKTEEAPKEVKNKSYWEKKKKEAEDARDALDETKKNSEEWKKLEKEIIEADKALQQWDDPTKRNKNQQKEENKEAKEAKKRAEEVLSIKRETQQAEIDLMKEGSVKRLAQLDLDFQKELDAIHKQEEEWKEAQSGKLTSEQSKVLADWDEKAFENYKKGVTKVNEDKAKAEKKAQQELLIQFGNYQEQKKGIEQKYADMKAETDVEGEKKLLDAQMKAELESLDERFGLTTTLMADLFEDASKKSVNSIQAIIDKYEMLVAFKSGAKQEDGTNVTKEELIGLGFSEKDLEALDKGEISIKDLTEKIKELKGELKEKSPWKSFTGNLEDAIAKIKNAKGDSSKIGEGITGIGSAVSSFTPALKEFSSNISNIFGFDDGKIQSAIDGLDGLGQTAAGVGQIMSGDIVSGAMAAAGGISKMVDAFEGMFGADYSQYNKMVEEYNGLIEVWDEIIARKKEYVSISFGDEARKAGDEAVKAINKEIDAYRTLGKERLNSGASIGSHSIGVRQKGNITKEGWNELLAASREVGFSYSSVENGRMEGLFSLSAEQLKKLQEQAPNFWAKLDEDVRDYLEKIIESNSQLEEIKDQLQETFTGVSFDSFYDNFVSKLSDMKTDSKAMADDFGENLKNAILSNLIANKYRSKIEALYNDWALKSDSDNNGVFDLTSEESQQLKDAQKALAEQIIAERDAMAGTFGWGETYSQETSSKGFQTMNQDTASALEGRFTALQIAGEEIRKQSEQQTVLQTLISNDVSIVKQEIALSKQYISEIVDIQYESVAYLSEISKNTKQLYQMNERLGKIEENTRNM